jgi:hypothetical protein
MFLEHRNRTFQGTFHNSPDYAWWYGYSALQEDLINIKYMAEDMRRNIKKPASAAPVAKKAAK